MFETFGYACSSSIFVATRAWIFAGRSLMSFCADFERSTATGMPRIIY